MNLDDTSILSQLEELSQHLGIQVRYESMKREGTFSPGGLCRLKGEWLLIINSKAAVRDKIEALASAVNRFDLSQIYLKPGLRDFLESFTEKNERTSKHE